MEKVYSERLFVGCQIPEPRRVKGVDICSRDDAKDRDLGEKIGEGTLNIQTGILGIFRTLSYGGGIGNVKQRAYNIIASRALKRNVTTACISRVLVESTEILPTSSFEFSLYKEN
ncbi:MAG: hypothetical protein KJ566_03540 [Nanoarchaeota archaeon]|nr:hypothetical protein [Nanoarchaeota archaeon]